MVSKLQQSYACKPKTTHGNMQNKKTFQIMSAVAKSKPQVSNARTNKPPFNRNMFYTT